MRQSHFGGLLTLCGVLCACYASNRRQTEPGIRVGKGNLALSHEKRLIKDLIDTYKQAGITGRPVKNSSEPILLKYGLGLVQILRLDEKNQVLTIRAWNRLVWTDYLLSWNASDYGGVSEVRVPAKDIWRPDLVLYNYADDRLKEFRDALCVVSSDGTVLWIPTSIFKSACSIDITNFPFDSQICHLKFGSWSYDGLKLDLAFYQDSPQISLEDYVPSNEWDVLAHPAKKNVIFYPCCPTPFPDLTFTVVIKRQVAFYSYILILPCVLLSLLTMVLFWLPPESPAKMQMGMNIFVAFFLLLLLLTENTPPAAASIPLIGAYYCLNMIMITLSTFLAVVVIHLYFRGPRTNRVPYWVKRIVLVGLARVVFMTNYVPKEKSPQVPDSSDPRLQKEFKKLRVQQMRYNKYETKELSPLGDSSTCTCRVGQSNAQNHNNNSHSSKNHVRDQYDQTPDMSPIHMYQSLECDVREIRRFIKTLIYKQKTQENLDKIRGEWRAVALVLDRIFFCLYTLSIIVSLATMFPRGT